MAISNEVQKKIILLGDAAVGKTSLIRKFVVDKYDDKYITTIGTKVTAKALQVEMNERVFYLKLQIWDILGQKGYSKLYNSCFRGANGVFLVADITRKHTLDSIEAYWIPKVQNIIGNLPFVILANKCDLINDAKFTAKDLREFASRYKAPFYLTSAKNGENVKRAFYILAKRMLARKTAKLPTALKPTMIESEKSDMVELIDRIIDDFNKGYEGIEDAMPVLRRQFKLAQLDLNNPTKEALRSAVNRLAEVEIGFLESVTAQANLRKRLKWIKET
ncbi:MAG: GTP-binding protein [Methanomassiliicoccales archaeon]|nr:MAG: GTP-binding protein [Methanomassiliicoccales archaeon]